MVTVRARPIWSSSTAPWATSAEVGGDDARFARVVLETLGVEGSASAPDEAWTADSLLSPSAALLAAVSVLRHTRLLARQGVPLHAAVVLTIADDDPLLPLGMTLGGQFMCTDAAYGRLAGIPSAAYYEWERRSTGLWECSYDSPLALLEPPFERLFAAEMFEWVVPRRRAAETGPVVAASRGEPGSPYVPDVSNDLFGVALSGGGMRSATFSLGVLQALARQGLLVSADYISSVSGGGYVGVSLAGLTADRLPYRKMDRLGLDYDHFPFTYPRALMQGMARPSSLEEAEANARSLPIHGNESPALWHVRRAILVADAERP